MRDTTPPAAPQLTRRVLDSFLAEVRTFGDRSPEVDSALCIVEDIAPEHRRRRCVEIAAALARAWCNLSRESIDRTLALIRTDGRALLVQFVADLHGPCCWISPQGSPNALRVNASDLPRLVRFLTSKASARRVLHLHGTAGDEGPTVEIVSASSRSFAVADDARCWFSILRRQDVVAQLVDALREGQRLAAAWTSPTSPSTASKKPRERGRSRRSASELRALTRADGGPRNVAAAASG